MKRSTVVALKVNVTNIVEVLSNVREMSKSKLGAYICLSNVHMCMESYDSAEFRNIVNNADMVLPDGRPIYWALRLLGNKSAQQVRGQDLMNAICAESASRGLKIGFYGGSSDNVLKEVTSVLAEQYPKISIVYKYSPPFRSLTTEEDASVIKAIHDSSVDVLFVGIGCPKQECWMAEHKDKLGCVMIGVGAAFDFVSGSKKHAPHILQVLGMEWLFRLLNEPKRLWKRYLKQNPRFMYLFALQRFLGRDVISIRDTQND